MIRAAAVAFVALALTAAPARAQDRTPARAPRPSGAHLGGVAPRTRRPPARMRAPAPDTSRAATSKRAPGASPPPADTALPPGVGARTSVEPKSVTVGDRFESGVALTVPAGTQVAVAVATDTADRWRALSPPAVSARDSARTTWLAIVRMVAWVPALPDSAGPVATVRLTAANGRVDSVRVKLAFPQVRATLPADSAKWVVRPPHDVWGTARDWRRAGIGIAVALLLLALLAILVVALLRRRRRKRIPATARERALALLERARASGFVEAGNWKAFYTLVSEALRGFAAEIRPRWSTDLTTSELLEAMRSDPAAASRADPLEPLLRVADLAKFARHGRDPDAAFRDLEQARAWVESYAEPGPEATETDPAAATAGAAP